ncbi:A-kinase anchor protein inhibitor 1 isoform X2 [Fukomys damarensis]|uniref:A-kinase anchor protein inhibitor 1 isoform X2 n=1 Tax=Fukomys damarensis TaxID=885580 RepID=UPI00053F5352|nr:A-kinase anchor protein inhibitor 1 isoform X2 [Fukomys damarensis]
MAVRTACFIDGGSQDGALFEITVDIALLSSREKPGSEPEEVKLQTASRQIVQTAILQAVQQVSRENRRADARASDSRGHRQLGVRELTKKYDKK